MLSSLRSPTGRCLLVLLLAVLGLQAVPSRPLPQVLERGPVFSAATYEVTLPPQREGVAQVQSVPAPTGGDAPVVEEGGEPTAFLPAIWRAHRSTGPPDSPPPRLIASPREPPQPV